MPRKKNVNKMTSDQLVRHLFHPKVVEHAKRVVREADQKHEKKATKKSI
jgi:hypothetical protein